MNKDISDFSMEQELKNSSTPVSVTQIFLYVDHTVYQLPLGKSPPKKAYCSFWYKQVSEWITTQMDYRYSFEE